MKRFCLCLVVLTLTACKPQSTGQEPSGSSTTSRSASVETTSSVSSSATSQASSSSVSSAISQSQTDAAPEHQTQPELMPPSEVLYARTLEWLAADTTLGRATHYAFVDIDGNGIDELLTARGEHLAAIYYLDNGVPTYLARTYVPDGGSQREFFYIYTDGTVEWSEWYSGSGQGRAVLYQLASDNSGVIMLAETPTDLMSQEVLDYQPYFAHGRTRLDANHLAWTAFH